MAPYGTAIGIDNGGNTKVRPERRGRRLVILCESDNIDYKDGQRVFYNKISPGKHVDFARIHYSVNSFARQQKSRQRVSRKHCLDDE